MFSLWLCLYGGLTENEWLRAYTMLVLRLDRADPGNLDYYGPPEWRGEVAAEEPVPRERLVADADALLDELPFPPPRARFLAAQVRAVRALAGPGLPLPELVRECLGLDVAPLPETVFEQAHAELDRALPKTAGTLAERLRAWQATHSLPVSQLDRLPDLVARAVEETRARTQAMITPLPDEQVDCALEQGVSYIAAAWHRGGTRSTILINGDRPFVLADLLYVVAHEGHPGHIAERVLKEIHLADRFEQRVCFPPSPPFVLSEGLGLHAQELIFPDDQAQAWLTEHIPEIQPDGSDFAAIHRARTVLFGAQANAALLAAEGRSVAEYLARWALLDGKRLDSAVASLSVPGGQPYIFAYYYGWRLLREWVKDQARVRRLLTEQLLPADLQDWSPLA